MKDKLKGTGVALVTPFRNDLSVDTEALRDLVSSVTTRGVEYLVVLGTTAETVTLNEAEKELVIRTIVEANAGRLPLVLGIGGNNTHAVAEALKNAPLEFDAILSVTPYYNRPTQEGLYQHFKYLAEASPLPIILYNVPGRTGCNMLPNTTIRLAHDFKSIVGIKEASGNLGQVKEILDGVSDDFAVISGDDITAWETVKLGGSGVISVLGQGLPQTFSTMIRAALAGNYQEAAALHNNLEEGMNLIFEEGNPAGIKALLSLQQIGSPWVRLPLVPASEALTRKLSDFLVAFRKEFV